MRILVVEDQPDLAALLKQGFEEERYAVDVALDGEEGLFLAQVRSYDLIILDILLPKLDGLSLLKHLRVEGLKTPVLMLTAKDDMSDKVKGLDGGADDYLTKPFGFAELLARIRALLRRGKDVPIRLLKVDDLCIDLFTHQVQRSGKPIDLTAKEYEVLEYLARNANRIVTRTELSEHVWAGDFESFSNVIDVFLYRLRQKIDQGFPHKMLYTVRGAGYVLKGPEGQAPS